MIDEEVDEELDDDEDEQCDILISLSGQFLNKDYISANKLTVKTMYDIFDQHTVAYEEFAKNPRAILKDRRLVVCIEDQIFRYEDAIQIMIS